MRTGATALDLCRADSRKGGGGNED